MAIKLITPDKESTTTVAGTQIIYTDKAATCHRYIMVHPEDVVNAADTLHTHMKEVTKKDIPIHAQEVSVNNKTVVFLSSGSPDFYFGAGEVDLPTHGRLVEMNLKAELTPIYKKLPLVAGRVYRGARGKVTGDFYPEHPDDKAQGYFSKSPNQIPLIAEQIYQDHEERKAREASAGDNAPVFDNPNATTGHTARVDQPPLTGERTI